MDCGPACLRMVSKYYGQNFNLPKLRKLTEFSREGTSLLGLSDAAEKIGFRTMGGNFSLDQLEDIQLPLILHWDQKHFVVLYKITSTGRKKRNKKYHIADPAKNRLTYDEFEFTQHWLSTVISGRDSGVGLILETTPDFYTQTSDKENLSFAYLAGYLNEYKKLIFQLFIGLGVGSLLQIILPFLTQSIVDVGINTRNLNFIYIILIAQTMLLFGRMSVEFIRSWILLHISTRINISILTDFVIKLMNLPIAFFDTKMTGDLMQRMNDQGRIQSFLTGSTLNILFSFFNLIIFSGVLGWYDVKLFLIFLLSSIVYSAWILFFLKARRNLDFKRFDISAQNQGAVIQLIGGIQEIKLNNCEKQKRWQWESIQANLFKSSIKTLSLNQIQQTGTFFINEGKNIFITFIVAKAVIDGQLTLGGMMAIQYIIGQLNSPIEQLLSFFQQMQDAKISLERLNDIHKIENEEPANQTFSRILPPDHSISLKGVTFKYHGSGNENVLTNISFSIPHGKTTAIVGASGSGKTTILKLLLKFYPLKYMSIQVGSVDINQISHHYWRGQCGTVMQDGFIFSDTIANNIAVGHDYPDVVKLENAIDVANIKEFVESLPLGLNTKIGQEGNGISQGQRQRILIARAVYKDPKYIFFDEATNSLDANNEKIIMEKLNSFFQGRTVVIVAHRLSTVKNADNIVVMDKGKILEQGTHKDLIKMRGAYFTLVKNQLDLDN